MTTLFSNVKSSLEKDLTSFWPDIKSFPIDTIDAISSCGHVSKRRVAAAMLYNKCFKKFCSRGSSDKLREAAIEKFLQANSASKSTNLSLRTPSAYQKLLMEEMRSVIEDWFHRAGCLSVPFGRIAQNVKTGPGASVGSEHTDFLRKVFYSPHTYSSSFVKTYFQAMIASDPRWTEAETIRLRKFGHLDGIERSKLTTVRKDDTSDRGIDIQPSLNMLFQLGTKEVLEDVLRLSGLDIRVQQSVNRFLACHGSLGRLAGQDPWCTIDLVSASDRLSLELCRNVLPRDWYNWFYAISTRESSYQKLSIGLEMMSTMGNGFTFPLQTLIFAALVKAVLVLNGRDSQRYNPRSRKVVPEYSIYGDDIICRRSIYPEVVRALEALGLEPNLKKSFSEGFFRESCGGDYFDGYDVRPVFCRSFDSDADIITFLNQLNRWSSAHGITLSSTVKCLLKALPYDARFFVPPYESDDAGIHVPFALAQDRAACSVLRVPYPITAFGPTMRVKLGCADAGSIVYQRYEPLKRELLLWSCTKVDGADTWEERYDPEMASAVLLSILGGYSRGRGSLVRMDKVRYKRHFAATPSWDCWRTFGGEISHREGQYRTWSRYVGLNLYAEDC